MKGQEEQNDKAIDELNKTLTAIRLKEYSLNKWYESIGYNFRLDVKIDIIEVDK